MFTGKFNHNRTFGIEIEAYGVTPGEVANCLTTNGITCFASGYTHEVSDAWKVVPDASIRGMYGFELVSPPLKGEAGLTTVVKVMELLQGLNARVNKSCGFHVHWDVSEANSDHIKGMLAVYSKFETVIDFLVSASRRNNQYCGTMRLQNSLEWVNLLPNGSAQNVAYHVSGGQARSQTRYRKLNINSFLAYGTVEFRQHQGTLNGQKAVDWIVFTQCIVEKAFGMKVKIGESAKPTIGELFRCLRICPHHTSDPLVTRARQAMLKNYQKFTANRTAE